MRLKDCKVKVLNERTDTYLTIGQEDYAEVIKHELLSWLKTSRINMITGDSICMTIDLTATAENELTQYTATTKKETVNLREINNKLDRLTKKVERILDNQWQDAL